MHSLFELLKAESCVHTSYVFPTHLFHRFMSAILDTADDASHLIGQLASYLAYDDVRFYYLKAIVYASVH